MRHPTDSTRIRPVGAPTHERVTPSTPAPDERLPPELRDLAKGDHTEKRKRRSPLFWLLVGLALLYTAGLGMFVLSHTAPGLIPFLPRLTAPAAPVPIPEARPFTPSILKPLPPLLDAHVEAHFRQVAAHIYQHINPVTRLGYSFTGDQRLEHWSVIFDNAIRAMMHIQTGDVREARRLVDYLVENTAVRKTGWIPKGGKLVPVEGWLLNIADAAETRYGGRGVEHIIHTGPNVYAGMAALQLYRATGDRKYRDFGISRWELIKMLQNENPDDPNYGGVRMGPMGDPANPYDQQVGFQKNNISFYNLYNGEHAADFLALSEALVEVDPKNAGRYEHAAQLIKVWDRNIFDPAVNLFLIGTTEKRFFDENIGQWVEPGPIPMYPLDTSALKISAYGVDGLEAFGPNAAEKVRAAIDDNFRVTVNVEGPDGMRRMATGYDFVGRIDRPRLVLYIEEGARGDIKVDQGRGRGPLLSDEWSTWVAFADLRLAEDFLARGDAERAARYLDAYRDNALVQALRTAATVDTGLAYAYAQPLPYSLNKPVGFGWNTHHAPYAMIAACTRILGALRFDPLRLGGGAFAINTEWGGFPLTKTPPKPSTEAIFTEVELYIQKAWRYVNRAEEDEAHADRYWYAAATTIERMMEEHPDWSEIATLQNNQARNAADPFPLLGRSNLTARDVNPIFRDYWALYHVGTGEFIRVMAYSALAGSAEERGDVRARDAAREKVLEAAEAISTRYHYAQTFDQSGWLWQPSLSLREFLYFIHN